MRKTTIIAILLTVIFLWGCGGASYGRFTREDTPRAPEDMMEKIQNAGTRRDYPNADVITIEEIDSTIYDPDGRMDAHSYSLMKILTMKEAKELSEIPIGYDSQVMDLQILFVRVIKEDGTVLRVSDSSIVDETMPGYSEQDIFWSNLRQKTITLPKLSMGDAIEFAIRFKGLQPYFEGIYDGSHYFTGGGPVLKSRNVVIAPDEDLDWKVYNDPEGKVSFKHEKYSDGYWKYAWEGENFEQIIAEPGVQNSDIATFVLYSNTTWKEFSKAAYEVSEPMMHPGPEIKAKVQELIKDKKTEYEKIMALHYYVAQEIRYIGVSLGGKEGITPHDVNETFKNKGGVCKDKSALLTVMLEEAGIEAYDALTHPQAPVKSEIAANQFMHMVVVAKMKNGEQIFLDVTDEFCASGLPGYYSHRGYLPMSEEGMDLEFIPLIPPEENMGKITADSKIGDDGTLTSTVTIEGTGIYDEVIRTLRMSDNADRERLFERMINGVHPNAELVSWDMQPDPLSNLWVPAQITIEYKVPDYAVVAGDYFLVKAPSSMGTFDLIVGMFLQQNTTLETREYPFEIMLTMALDIKEAITIPSGYRPKILPDAVNERTGIADVEAKYSYTDNILKYNAQLRVKDSFIQLDQYPDLRKVSQSFEKAGDGQAILVKGGNS